MIKSFLELPGMRHFLSTNLWKSYRHSVALRNDCRENSNFTGFYRLPTQFEALSGPVIEYLVDENTSRPLRIASIGCSNGAEAYTIASVLTTRHPNLRFEVHALDIDEAVVEKAKTATFVSETEVFNNKHISDEFVRTTFDIDADSYLVKEPIKKHVSFSVADVLDVESIGRFTEVDIVFAQNFLFHLEPTDAMRAFNNICGMLSNKAALFVDGTDLPLRHKLTRTHALLPLDFKIEQIHNEARWARAIGYPYRYWGLEPFMASRGDWQRRYATIFLRNET